MLQRALFVTLRIHLSLHVGQKLWLHSRGSCAEASGAAAHSAHGDRLLGQGPPPPPPRARARRPLVSITSIFECQGSRGDTFWRSSLGTALEGSG
jgi:hypothetical protein